MINFIPKCRKCGKDKTIPFSPASKFDSYCRDCNTIRARRYRKTAKGKEIIKRISARSSSKYPEKTRARTCLNRAISKGYIVKPSICTMCESKDKKLDGHHEDYSKPLDVIWMCRKCHSDYEKVIKAMTLGFVKSYHNTLDGI